jgi:hypothetical protein
VSMRTIRPRPSITSVSTTFAAWTPALLPPKEHSSSSFNFDIASSIQSLLYNLRITYPGLYHEISRNNPSLLDNTEHLAYQIIAHFRSIADQAQEELTQARTAFQGALQELGIIKKKVKDSLDRRGLEPLARSDCRGRKSGDSQATAVSLPAEMCAVGGAMMVNSNLRPTSASSSPSTRRRFMQWPGWLPHLLPDSPTFKSHFSSHAAEPPHHDMDTKSLTKKDTAFLSGTMRLTSWIKKKVKPESQLGSEVDAEKRAKKAQAVPESSLCFLKGSGTKSSGTDAVIEKVLRTAHICLGTADRDLGSINDLMNAVCQMPRYFVGCGVLMILLGR